MLQPAVLFSNSSRADCLIQGAHSSLSRYHLQPYGDSKMGNGALIALIETSDDLKRAIIAGNHAVFGRILSRIRHFKPKLVEINCS